MHSNWCLVYDLFGGAFIGGWGRMNELGKGKLKMECGEMCINH